MDLPRVLVKVGCGDMRLIQQHGDLIPAQQSRTNQQFSTGDEAKDFTQTRSLFETHPCTLCRNVPLSHAT
jgi:hypothetical protein